MKQSLDKRRVTIYDIAKEAEVSPSLVSRVLSGNGSVSAKSREKIEKAIEKYNYRPNAMARGLQKSKTGLIGFVLPHIGNEYFSSVYYEFEKIASANNYMVTLFNSKNDYGTEEKILGVLEEARVEAVIYMGGQIDQLNPNPANLEAIRKLNKTIPCILCCEQAGRFNCIGVHSDDQEGIRQLLEHLIHKGYRKMGILGGASSVISSKYRKGKLVEGANACGIEIRKEWIVGNSYNEVDGMECMSKLLEEKDLPDVVCCINDHVAYGAQLAILDAGLKIPKDIAVIGFDGVKLSELARPKITTVATDFETLGKTIFEVMIARMGEEECEPLNLVKPKLIIKESSK